MLACGTPNGDPTVFVTVSWTDPAPTKNWLGCTFTNGETKEVYSTSYSYLPSASPTHINWDWLKEHTGSSFNSPKITIRSSGASKY
jgi:hypothetical protein